MTAAIEAHGASKSFITVDGRVDALREVSLDVQLGEVVSLVGPSGCGKSTLLNLIAGLDYLSAGAIEVFGRSVAGVRSEIGMMFQTPVLLAWRTVLQNVLLPIEVARGRSAARAAEDEAMRLLGKVGLSGFEQKLPAQLSGGMQQRAAICRMLISDPQVLLLDEPFSALDEITRESMNLELARIMGDGHRASVFVTHNIPEAVFLSDRVIAMTGRPGSVAGTVTVELARPRHPDISTAPEFQDPVRRVRRYLNLAKEEHAMAS